MHKWYELMLSVYSVLVAGSELNQHCNIQQLIYIVSGENALGQYIIFKLNYRKTTCAFHELRQD